MSSTLQALLNPAQTLGTSEHHTRHTHAVQCEHLSCHDKQFSICVAGHTEDSGLQAVTPGLYEASSESLAASACDEDHLVADNDGKDVDTSAGMRVSCDQPQAHVLHDVGTGELQSFAVCRKVHGGINSPRNKTRCMLVRTSRPSKNLLRLSHVYGSLATSTSVLCCIAMAASVSSTRTVQCILSTSLDTDGVLYLLPSRWCRDQYLKDLTVATLHAAEDEEIAQLVDGGRPAAGNPLATLQQPHTPVAGIANPGQKRPFLDINSQTSAGAVVEQRVDVYAIHKGAAEAQDAALADCEAQFAAHTLSEPGADEAADAPPSGLAGESQLPEL